MNIRTHCKPYKPQNDYPGKSSPVVQELHLYVGSNQQFLIGLKSYSIGGDSCLLLNLAITVLLQILEENLVVPFS